MAFVAPIFSSLFLSRPSLMLTPRRRPSPRLSITAELNVPDVLSDILARKKIEVEQLKATVSSESDHPIANALKTSTPRTKAFYDALNIPKGSLTVIGEIKRKSPSKGVLASLKDPTVLSRVYYEGGAAAISILTDFEGFGGTIHDIEKVVRFQKRFEGNYPGPCPVLRKDFIIDEIQIAEALVAGASAVLLIVSALGKDRTKQLLDVTHAMGLDALVEVHDEQELQIALDAGAEIIGINNRDLRTFEVSLETSFKLVPFIPDGIIKVSESGISDCVDAWKLRDAGFQAVLVGETLVKAYDGSSTNNTGYTVGYNQAKGYIKAFKAKGSVKFGSSSMAPFFGKGEGAKERLGEISI